MASTLDPVAGQVVTAAYLRAWMANWAPIAAIKLSNTSRASTTTLTADPELQVALLANTTYMWETHLEYDAGAGLIAFGVDVPAGGASTVGTGGLDTTVTASTSGIVRLAGGGAGIGAAGAGVAVVARFSGRIVTTSAGTADIRWAQVNSNATASILHAGSWFRCIPFPV